MVVYSVELVPNSEVFFASITIRKDWMMMMMMMMMVVTQADP